MAQWLERRTGIHGVVGSSPTRRSNFSNLNLYNCPCLGGVPPFPPKEHTQPVPRVEVIKFGKIIVHLNIPRLDSSDLLVAQWFESRTGIHGVVGSSPTRKIVHLKIPRLDSSDLLVAQWFITLLVPGPGGCSPPPRPSLPKNTHTHRRSF